VPVPDGSGDRGGPGLSLPGRRPPKAAAPRAAAPPLPGLRPAGGRAHCPPAGGSGLDTYAEARPGS